MHRTEEYISDPDNLISSVTGITPYNRFIIDNIQDIGSINTYNEALDYNDIEILTFMKDNGFNLTQSHDIIHGASQSELDDCFQSRFEAMIPSISLKAFVTGDKHFINPEHTNYLCWNSFDFVSPYGYEYYFRWMGSMEDISKFYYSKVDVSLFLICELHISEHEVVEILHKVLPDLPYIIKSSESNQHRKTLTVNLNDIAKRLS